MIFRGSVEGSVSAKKGRLTMNRIRLAFSIVSLTAVLTFGLTLTSRIARADQRIPECNCYTSPPNPYTGMSCNADGQLNPFGQYCCPYECILITE